MKRLALCLSLAACSDPTAGVPGDATSDAKDHSQLDARPTGSVDAPLTARDPAMDGDEVVSSTVVSIPGSQVGGNLPATVFAAVSTSLRPLVVISPGFQMARTQYVSYARHLATWGIVAVLTDYSDSGIFASHQVMADDVSAVIDWSLAQSALKIDPTKIAVAGHSLGGKVSLLAAANDSRIAAVVAWDPVDSSSPSVAPEKMHQLTAAVMLIGETTNSSGGGMPCAPAADNFLAFYAAAASPATAVTVVGADHMDWVDDPSCFVCSFCGAGAAAPELARTVTRRIDVAWLRSTLLGDVEMQPWLASPPQLATGEITIQHK